MNRRSGGTKRSSWLTFRRRLLLVRLLLRSPATGEDLIAAVQAELQEDGYPANAAAALKHDLDSLKGEYSCRIIYQRDSGRYALIDLGELALLDLSEQCMEALAFLDASYPPGSAIPEQVGVRALLDQVIQLLPTERQEQHRRRRSSARMSMPAGGTGRIDPNVLASVRRAIDERRELAFKYWSTFDIGAPRRHRVAPYGVFFRPEGHGYLDGTLLEVTPPGGETAGAAIDYRLDRIVPGTVQVLPGVLPPERLQPRTYTLRYRLHPNVARRRDVAAYFPNTRIDYHDDGAATVVATITNLWQARQILLRYGDACRVQEPPELIELFRQAARGLADIYDADT